MAQRLRRQIPAGDDGASPVEYGLMLSLVFVVAAVRLRGGTLVGASATRQR